MYSVDGVVLYTLMTGDADLSRPWEGDINDAVVEEWKQETTAFERVVSVVDTTAEPAHASEIAERAVVSEPTARRHLESLAEVGRVDAVSADRGTKYRRSPSTLAMRRVAGLQRQYSKSELQDGIRDLREKLQALRETHGVNDPDDLATSLEVGSDHWTDVSRWRSLEENLAVAKAALSLYDFDPDDIGAVSGTEDGSSGERAGDGLAVFGAGRSA